MLRRLSTILFSCLFVCVTSLAAANPFEHGWSLDGEASSITFLSVKKDKIAELSEFASISGQITESGIAQLVVALDSVDTKIDLRNVRMRFLFFETFNFPEATVTAVLDPSAIQDLPQLRRKTMSVPVTLDLHGAKVELAPRLAVTLLDNDRVNISSIDPVILQLQDFNLLEGREKLQEAANVTITPLGIVNLNLTFQRNATGTVQPVAAAATGAGAALEDAGDFSTEACLGRFEILSRSRSINFAAGTSRLDKNSLRFLDSLYDIVSRCPDMIIEIGGHTDDKGSTAANQRLSEKRAHSVARYLAQRGIPARRLHAVGFGESRPLVANSSASNRAKNRRITFRALD